MARIGRLGFLAIAVVFHLIYVRSIFDIYFVSPIVSGMRAYSVQSEKAPAKRLVLFVGDGLRADKAFQSFPDPSPPSTHNSAALEPRPLAPFLRSRVLEHGTFGVSHTRVPTESRPGHVALIAGLYEDVSAVMTGWKVNPVNFDSVFNRSRHTWSWGSPDILPMFEQGAVPGRIDAYTYPAEFEDFSKDATELDTWVFDRVVQLFQGAETNRDLDAALRRDKNLFFLHLLGLDTTGHAYRPYSREYLHNIKIVDRGVQQITEMIEAFYGDDETAFVFTADHGMSDWGSHGDGHPDNTRTPLIAWGSGVAKPVTSRHGKAAGHEDGFSSDWNLDHVQRNDVAQADVAALMAYLAGLAFPVNSVGELPLPYLAASEKEQAEALLVNAREILEMYRIKEQEKMAVEMRYVPYRGFADSEHSTQHRVQAIRDLIHRGTYQEAIQDTDQLIQLGLQALRYLQTYDWLFLRTLITLGYLGWIAFAFTTAVDSYILSGRIDAGRSLATTSAFAAVLVALYALLFIQSSPLTYYAYAVFPVFFWEEVVARRAALVAGWEGLFAHVSRSSSATLALNVFLYLAVLEVMVQSYYHRQVYTILYPLLAGWPLFYGREFVRRNRVLALTWAASCISMSVFTLLPAIKVESSALIQLGGVLMLMVGLTYIVLEKRMLAAVSGDAPDALSRSILGVQVGLVALAILVTRSSVASLQAKQGLPLGTQMLGWFTLVTSLLMPFAHRLSPRTHYIHRLAVIFLAFAPMFVILTISYEGLFYVAIAATLISWVRLEAQVAASTYQHLPSTQHKINNNNKDTFSDYRALSLSDTRICLFFLFLLQSSFFSTGNIASVSSFSLDAVYRLIPVFDPFSQSALLLLKLLAPFALVSANLGILTKRLRLRAGSLFAVVMAVGDYLTLRFFWEVRDEGSWLDIGESISMFCIASGLCIFVAALEAFSELFVKGVEFEQDDGAAAREEVGDGALTSALERNGSVKGGIAPHMMNGGGVGHTTLGFRQ